ncbi:sugar phosphate isomerase/epimerase [Acuticoccus sp. M5D2P5]|uniref:sugar phosphate isomerase/epimerase family protein n=1 Tax=Acuticoccus kalidii TaxID=2910977 RepID=UPI001F2ADBD9|nr:sugar phosphate isomerase/epimerase family protein [Acuticoccus kalidii]MCF3936310.1 sugar phosphate isomerase/epimerase [Acuticoccus kalidii]
MLRFAYNTNGCTNHRLDDALDLIAEAGYSGVALALDVHHFDPFMEGYEAAAEALAKRLAELDLGLVVETSAPYLLDPREANEPSLLHPASDGRDRRLDFLRRAIRIAKIAGADSVGFTSGRTRRGVSQQDAGVWLLDGLRQVVEFAAEEGVVATLEPAPGHMVGTLDDFVLVRETLKQMTDAPLRLSLDVGHSLVTNDRDPAKAVKEFAPVLGAVSLEDMKRGVHAHLPFGEGDMNIPAVLKTLEEIEFQGLVTVELPLHSPRAHEMIVASYDWLQENLPSD